MLTVTTRGQLSLTQHRPPYPILFLSWDLISSVAFLKLLRPTFHSSVTEDLFFCLIIMRLSFYSRELRKQPAHLYRMCFHRHFLKRHFPLLCSCTKDASTLPVTSSSIPCTAPATSTARCTCPSPPPWLRSWTGCPVCHLQRR